MRVRPNDLVPSERSGRAKFHPGLVATGATRQALSESRASISYFLRINTLLPTSALGEDENPAHVDPVAASRPK